MSYQFPVSPNVELDGFVYLPRFFDKIRLHHAGKLHPDYHQNLGKGFDASVCQFFQIDYPKLVEFVLSQNASDQQALNWIYQNGVIPNEFSKLTFRHFMLKRGFRDDLSAKLIERKKESNAQDRDDIQTFFDYIDLDENRK